MWISAQGLKVGWDKVWNWEGENKDLVGDRAIVIVFRRGGNKSLNNERKQNLITLK